MARDDDETQVTKIHRETMEAIDRSDADLTAMTSRVTDLERLLRKRSISEPALLGAIPPRIGR